MTPVTVIGIDYATTAGNLGVAIARIEGTTVTVTDLPKHSGPSALPSESVIAEALAPKLASADPILLAVDIPFGWPAGMGPALSAHHAGEQIESPAAEFFLRHTDRHVQERVAELNLQDRAGAIRPMSVGADRIARAALSWQKALHRLRTAHGHPIPVLVRSDRPPGSGAIEVYPAATLRAFGLPFTGYKGSESAARDRRAQILAGLEALGLRPDPEERALRHRLVDSDHALDAVICTLAAREFLRGNVYDPPADRRELIRKEGWMWVPVLPNDRDES